MYKCSVFIFHLSLVLLARDW